MRRYKDSKDGPRAAGSRSSVVMMSLLLALLLPCDVPARVTPFDREDRPAACAAADELLAAHTADIVPGIPAASERLREQLRTAEGMQPSEPSQREQTSDGPMTAPKRSVSPSKAADSEDVDGNLPVEQLAWLGLFGMLGAGVTWWASRRRSRPAPESRSFSPEEVRAALAEIAAAKRGASERPHLSAITRLSTAVGPTRRASSPPGQRLGTVSLREPVQKSAPNPPSVRLPEPVNDSDRMERIERSLLAFTDVVQTLVDAIPPRAALDRDPKPEAQPADREASGRPEEGKILTTEPAEAQPADREASVNESALSEMTLEGRAETPTSSHPSQPEEELASAWERFLEVEGVAETPAKATRKGTSGASRIARQGRASRAAKPKTPATREQAKAYQSLHKINQVPESSAGQGMPSDALSDLARVREVVLDLAGRGVPTEEICREVALNPKEVGLILKSLFRTNV